NVSFFLYQRQARYYALSTFFTLLVAYLYLHQDGSRKKLWGLALAAVGLLATHYIAYAGLMLALAVDHLAFGRKRRAFSWPELAVLLGAQAALGGAIVSVWYPLRKAVTDYHPASWLHDRLTLFYWNLRDANACEFGIA